MFRRFNCRRRDQPSFGDAVCHSTVSISNSCFSSETSLFQSATLSPKADAREASEGLVFCPANAFGSTSLFRVESLTVVIDALRSEFEHPTTHLLQTLPGKILPPTDLSRCYGSNPGAQRSFKQRTREWLPRR